MRRDHAFIPGSLALNGDNNTSLLDSKAGRLNAWKFAK